MIGDPFGLNLAEPINDGLRASAGWILGEAENQARHAAPDIKVTAALFAAGAAPTLLSQAQDAELVVVGSRGLGGFRGLPVGSVSATEDRH
jgi:nucleotide-binding universal stress UspA family protein